MKKSELKQLIRESYNEILKEEIKEVNGKRYKKQSNGKWVEVSELGMTKNEHENISDEFWHAFELNTRFVPNPGSKSKLKLQSQLEANAIEHSDLAKLLSNKEYTDEELNNLTENISLTKSKLKQLIREAIDEIEDENLEEGFVDWLKGVNWYKKYWKLAFGYYKKIDPEIAKVVAKKGVAEEKAGWKMLSGDTKFRDALVKFSSTISAGTGAVGGGSTKVVPAWVTKLVDDYKKNPSMFDDEIDDIVGGMSAA